MSPRALAALGALTLLAAGGAGEVSAAAPAARASLPAIERQVMCVTCKIPLNLAQSPQADRERALIGRLIAQGRSEAQIKRALVAQYGRAVLALPSASGFGVLAYAVPLAVVTTVTVVTFRWTRRDRPTDGGGRPQPQPGARSPD